MEKIKEPMTFEQYTERILKSHARFIPIIADSIKSRTQSPIEAKVGLILWTLYEEFGTKNLQVTPQKKIGKYRVDFEVLYKPFHVAKDSEPLRKIVIECDGHDFHEKTKEQVSKDKERDRELQKMGYVVLRYSGSDIYNHFRMIREDVYDIIDPDEKKEIEEWLEKQRAEGWV